MTLAGRSTEACMVILLNSRNHVIGNEIIAEGTVNRTHVFPRRVVEIALERKAAGLILVHNHPAGRPDPSSEDDLLTRKIKTAADAVELRFQDHLIVAKDGHFSYRAAGLM